MEKTIEECIQNCKAWILRREGCLRSAQIDKVLEDLCNQQKAICEERIEELEAKLAQTSCYEEGFEEGYAVAKKEIIDKAVEWLNNNARHLLSAELRRQFRYTMEV